MSGSLYRSPRDEYQDHLEHQRGPKRVLSGREADLAGVLEGFGTLMRHVAGSHAEAFIGIDVTMAQAKCLYVIANQPGVGLSALAARLGVSLSALSGLVERLVEHGYVERHEAPDDRRQQQVWLTPAGEAAIGHLRELDTAELRGLLDGLSDDELAGLHAGITGLAREAATRHPLEPIEREHEPERTTL
jgi:DNA-binding MarR family transcriptional regulator